MLSQGAFNALLKTLEEPPSYAIFILATTEKHKILPTILSRCQIYDFNRINIQDTVEHLQYVANKENIQFFTQLIEKYSDIQELNARILNELIEKIVVSEKEIIDGEKYQCVHIHYKFVGLMSI